jgi:hypothetical protein
MSHFYLDTPETLVRLRQWATSEFQQALRIAEELRDAELYTRRSRRYLDEIMAQVEMMCANLTATNYELVLGKLDQVRELHALVTGEEENYTQTKEYVDSVREEILVSQGVLSKWQSTLLSHAYERGLYPRARRCSCFESWRRLGCTCDWKSTSHSEQR